MFAIGIGLQFQGQLIRSNSRQNQGHFHGKLQPNYFDKQNICFPEVTGRNNLSQKVKKQF